MLKRQNKENSRRSDERNERAMDDFRDDQTEDTDEKHGAEPNAGDADQARVHRCDGDGDRIRQSVLNSIQVDPCASV